MSEIAINFENVIFSYHSNPVLTDVNLSIQKLDYVSIVGPNGGGKTTLLQLMLGLLKPDSGKISVLGQSPDRFRSKFGYMPQSMQFDLHFPMTVCDVVLMGCLTNYSMGRYSKEDREAAFQSMQELSVADLSEKLFSELSGGQRQRVLLARALVGQPEILLLDEPSANIDIRMEEILFGILQELNQRMTIVLVSHDLSFVSKAVTSVYCVNKTVVRHPISNITPQAIADIYSNDMRIIRHDQHLHNGEDKHD